MCYLLSTEPGAECWENWFDSGCRWDGRLHPLWPVAGPHKDIQVGNTQTHISRLYITVCTIIIASVQSSISSDGKGPKNLAQLLHDQKYVDTLRLHPWLEAAGVGRWGLAQGALHRPVPVYRPDFVHGGFAMLKQEHVLLKLLEDGVVWRWATQVCPHTSGMVCIML